MHAILNCNCTFTVNVILFIFTYQVVLAGKQRGTFAIFESSCPPVMALKGHSTLFLKNEKNHKK